MKSERATELQEKRFQYDPFLDDSIQNEKNYRKTRYIDQTQPVDEYSLTLKKTEIAAAAKIACAYLGIHQQIKVDKDISDAEILKYQGELTNF